MKNKIKIKLSLVVAVAVMFSYTSVAFATEGNYAENAKVNAITREDLFIPDDVAVEIAKFFIKDMIMTGAVEWNNETEVINTTIMYTSGSLELKIV